jgi:hypothetical protein
MQVLSISTMWWPLHGPDLTPPSKSLMPHSMVSILSSRMSAVLHSKSHTTTLTNCTAAVACPHPRLAPPMSSHH